MFALANARPNMNIAESLRGEIIVLHYIEKDGGPVKPSEISRGIKRTTARVAATLNNLEKKGLVTREIDADDRRRILVRITHAGRELIKEKRRDAVRMTAKMLSSLGEEDARAYVRITGKLVAYTQQMKEKKQ